MWCNAAWAALPRVVVASGGPYVAKDTSIQKFQASIQIPTSYVRQPLVLVCTNGSQSEPGFSWVRMFLLPGSTDADLQPGMQPVGRLLVNESSFQASPQAYIDMTGQLSFGKNDLIIEGAGVSGAAFTWEVRSIGRPIVWIDSPTLTCGETTTLYGTGFSLRPAENIVRLDYAAVPVLESSFEALKIMIPRDVPAGNYVLTVSIGDYRSAAIKVSVRKPSTSPQ